MKRVAFTVTLLLLAVIAFGQKKAINATKAEIGATTPNISEARNLIKGALENPETADLAETWYIAGSVENKQFTLEQEKEFMVQTPNADLMFPALVAIYPYFEKAFELDNRPNEKGKVSPKYTKDIRVTMLANRPYYINAGAYYWEQENFQKAYENFRFYGDYPNLPIFQGDTKTKFTKMEADTSEINYRYYAALAASLIPNREKAIELYDEIKDLGFKENDIYQLLAGEYLEIKDTVACVGILEKGMIKFPTNVYYILNLININLVQEKSDDAIVYLNKAIEVTPDNAQLYDVLGLVYENTKETDKAISYILKALDLEPENPDYLSHIGRMYYNRGLEERTKADDTKDSKLAQALEEQYKASFRQSIPYFEKAYKLNSEDRDAIFALRNMYYSLNNNAEFEKWNTEFEKLTNSSSE